MSRFKLTIEYDGTKFVGWQRQINGLGVQQVLEEAVTAFCGETINAFAAGRTDTGVHALGQVAHIDIEKETDADTVRDALNYHMRPHRVVILKSESVSEDFHARFSAKERIYQYKIINRRSPLAVQVNRALWVSVLLDTDAMHEAAQVLVGKHDFTSFRAVACQADSPEKTLNALDVVREGETVIITARARSFLHHQVRNMVGTLKLVGEGKWTAKDVSDALAARDRSAAGMNVPPDGLYFQEVIY
jgi:tRNA pseudouridine38-40 synthase